MRRVQALDETMHWEELSLVLMDDQGIARVHRTHLGAHRTTDVISFAYPPTPGATTGHTAEVLANVQRAAALGPRYGGASEELARYIAHGCHHLAGADDDTQPRRARMRRVEERWLRQAKEEGLLATIEVKPI